MRGTGQLCGNFLKHFTQTSIAPRTGLVQSSDVVDSIFIENAQLKAEILPVGAALTGLWGGSDPRSLILGLNADANPLRPASFYSGVVVGPIANRVAKGRVTVSGRTFRMPRNEDGRATLHSGPEGLHRAIWQVQQRDRNSLTLSTQLPNGACGLPGARAFWAIYTLENTTLDLTLRAVSDTPTLFNLAHHPYWAINNKARLQVSAKQVVRTQSAKLPTGTLDHVTGTKFDLTKSVPIRPELDHCYVLSREVSPAPRYVARLDMGHYRLRLETTAPGLQVYAGSGLPSIPANATNGWPIGPNTGLALEPQFWPDAPNHRHFPSIEWPAGQVWEQRTRYILKF